MGLVYLVAYVFRYIKAWITGVPQVEHKNADGAAAIDGCTTGG